MADIRYKTSSLQVGANGQSSFVHGKALLDGTPFTAEWLAKMALEGRMYTVNAGTGTSPITFAASYTATAPDLDMSVPSGVLIIPIALHVEMQVFGSSALLEIVAAYGKGGVIAPTSATPQTAVNHRIDKANDSGVTIVSDGTGATFMTPAISVIEFFRGGQDKVATIGTADDDSSRGGTGFSWSAMESGVWPIMYATDGITRLNIHCSANAGTGFITLTFVKPPLATE